MQNNDHSKLGHMDSAWLCATHLQSSIKEERIEKHEYQQEVDAFDPDAYLEKKKKAMTMAKTEKNKKSIYVMENIRLATLMRDKQFHKKIKKKKKPRPRVVDDMLAIEKRYANAARRLQKWWRSYLRRLWWKEYFLKVKATIQIQRIMRGYLCRKLVRIYHYNLIRRIVRIQSAFRGYLMRKVLGTWKKWHMFNVVKFQSIVRAHFARQLLQQRKKQIACLHIQMLWRGYCARKHTYNLWLSTKAINLQRLIRGALARRHVREWKIIVQEAAIHIQRMYRGMCARQRVEEILRDRETKNRKEFMTMLEIEEEWYCKQRDKVITRLERLQLEKKVYELESEYFKRHEQINDMESILLDMKEQRLRISPRAIEEGWVEEMENKMKIQRAKITQLKMDTIFHLGLEFKKKDEEFSKLKEKIHLFETKRKQFERWRREEYLVYWKRECKYLHEKRQEIKKKHIAETKRKWTVQFHTLQGKPDKRRHGQTWDENVLKAAEAKQIFTMANTNILAFTEQKLVAMSTNQQEQSQQQEDTKKDKLHELELSRVELLEEQVTLVTSDAQIEQTKAILEPFFDQVEKAFQDIQKNDGYPGGRTKLPPKPKKFNNNKTGSNQLGSPTSKVSPPKKDKNAPLSETAIKRRIELKTARVPWHLLDELEAERKRFHTEKLMFKVWGKISKKGKKYIQSTLEQEN